MLVVLCEAMGGWVGGLVWVGWWVGRWVGEGGVCMVCAVRFVRRV